MNTEIPVDKTFHPVTDAVREGAEKTALAAKEAGELLSVKAQETLSRTKDYARQNPVPVLLGALIVGATIGCLVALSRRSHPTLRERFMDDPVHTARDILQATFQPVGRRIHDGYDSARDGAEHAYESFQDHFPVRRAQSLGRQIVNNLKFW